MIMIQDEMGERLLMNKFSVHEPDCLQIAGESDQEPCYGCNQEWYETEWQRRAGCGPTVAATLFYYLFRPDNRCYSKQEWLERMEEVWNYVTPTERGMPTTQRFYRSVLDYAATKQQSIDYFCCDVPEERADRPVLADLLQFLTEGLQGDAAIAFLNLCNGEEQNLHRWHWVTIIAVEHAADGSQALLKILDEGKIKTEDLALWLETTTLGGGFVYFQSQK